MLSISAHNAISARGEALTQQLAQAAIAHHPVVSPFEELERWLSRRSQVLHLQLTLLRDAAGPDGDAEAEHALAQRYRDGLDALTRTIAERYRETIEARMPLGKIAHVVAEDGKRFVPLDADELARRMARFEQRVGAEMEMHRCFSFGPPPRRAALIDDLRQEADAIESLLCELKEQLDALNLPTVDLQGRVAQTLARLRAERHATVIDAGLHQGWLRACEQGCLHAVQAIVQAVPEAERRPFIDRLGPDGRNAFHLACAQQDLALATWLVQLGADPLARTGLGLLPMQLATHHDRGERTRTLLAWLALHRADPLARDENGRSALNEAAYHGNRSAIGWLLQHGASLCERDIQQRTPLHAAAAGGDAATIALLLALGADPHARNAAGERPIFEACRMGQAEAMQAFLDAGVWLNAQEREHLRLSGMVTSEKVVMACAEPLRRALAQLSTQTKAAPKAGAEPGRDLPKMGKADGTGTKPTASVNAASQARPVIGLPQALQRLLRR